MLWGGKSVLVQIAPGVIIKDIAFGWEVFMQHVAIILKMKELPKGLRENISKNITQVEHYRAKAKTLNTPVSTIT